MPDQVEPVVAAEPSAPSVPQIPETPATEVAVAPAQGDQAIPASAEPVAVETPPAATGEATAPVSEPTLLEKFDADKAKAAAPAEEVKAPVEEPKPTVEPKAEEPKPEVAKPEGEVEPVVEAAPVELPKIEYFADEGGIKLPETIKIDDAQRTELVTALDAFRAKPSAEAAQGIIDMGAKMMTAFAQQKDRDQWDTFHATRKGWVTQTMADPELGGAGYETAMARVAHTRDQIVSRHAPGTEGYQKDLAEFNTMLRVTGVGDHPAFLRMMSNGARFFKEATVPPPDPRPTPTNGRAPRSKGAIYPNTQFNT